MDVSANCIEVRWTGLRDTACDSRSHFPFVDGLWSTLQILSDATIPSGDTMGTNPIKGRFVTKRRSAPEGLSYWKMQENWSGRRDSNPRPQPWQGERLLFLASSTLLLFPDFRHSQTRVVLGVIDHYVGLHTLPVGMQWGKSPCLIFYNPHNAPLTLSPQQAPIRQGTPYERHQTTCRTASALRPLRGI